MLLPSSYQTEDFDKIKNILGRNINRSYYTDKKILDTLQNVIYSDNVGKVTTSKEDFINNFEITNIPVILLELTKSWELFQKLNLAFLKQLYGESQFKIGEDGDGKRIEITLKQFMHYKKDNNDENPLYLFDGELTKISTEGKRLTEYYSVPEQFNEDLFHILESARPQYRWILIGPQRSGSLIHIDPYMTSAWNTSLQGRKRWVLFSGDAPKKLVTGKQFVEQGFVLKEDIQTPIAYFHKVLPLLLSCEEIKEFKFYECIQQVGETMFVPRGWWHAVINLDDTLAITQNFVSLTNFPFVWRQLRIENPGLAVKFLQKLKDHDTKLYDCCLQLNKDDEFQMLVQYDNSNNDQMQEDDQLDEFDNSLFQDFI